MGELYEGVCFLFLDSCSSAVHGEQASPHAPFTSSTPSQLHTPTQPISSTHTLHTASPNISKLISHQPSDTVTSDQPSPSSSCCCEHAITFTMLDNLSPVPRLLFSAKSPTTSKGTPTNTPTSKVASSNKNPPSCSRLYHSQRT